MARRLGSATTANDDSTRHIYRIAYIRVKLYYQSHPRWRRGARATRGTMVRPKNIGQNPAMRPSSARVLSQVVLVVGSMTTQTAAERSANPRSYWPLENATGVCPDTPLRITFAGPSVLGAGGKIRIFDAADDTAVETVDVASPMATKTIGGLAGYQYYPVILSASEATVYPRSGVLAYNKTYYVSVDAGVFRDATGAALEIAPRKTWRFTTKAASPSHDSKRLTIAADGAGDFCTVQGALDFVPEGNTTPTTLFVRKGTYTEMVFFANKHAITLLGEDRRESVVTYTNNDRFNPASGNPYAVAGANPSDAMIGHDAIYRRAVFMAHRANDLVISNLTIRNATPTGGSQAEAVILNGTQTARAILEDVDLISTQDTLQINGQGYVTHSTIEGDVDFMWGQGPAFFDGCVCHSLRSNAPYSQIRNPGTHHGFVYAHCTFDGVPGVTGNYLSRIKVERFPSSELILIDDVLGASVDPVLWQIQDQPAPDAGAANVHFWEYGSHDAAGKPVDVSRRLDVSRQLKKPDDASIIGSYSNPAYVLGNAWNPKAAPIFTASGRRSER
jgi:pectin methylesterase-like acyl-CoA thioesterase